MSDLKKHLFQSFGWSIAGVFGRGGLSFILAPFAMHCVGLDNYGILLLFSLYSYVGILQFFDLGLPVAFIKLGTQAFCDGEYDKLNHIVSFSFFMMIFLGGACSIGLFAIGSLMGGVGATELSRVVVFFLAVINFLQFVFYFFLNYLMVVQQSVISKKIETFFNLGWSLLSFGTIAIYKTKFVIPFQVLSISLVLVCLFIAWRQARKKSPISFQWKVCRIDSSFRGLWRSSFFLRLNGLSFKQSNSMLISIFLPPIALGALDVSTKFLSFIKTVLGKMNELLMPYFIALHNEKKETALEMHFFTFLHLQLFISWGAGIMLFFYPELILESWIRKDVDHNLIVATSISGLALIFAPYAYYVTTFLTAVKKDLGELVKFSFLINAFALLGSFVLIRWLGLVGAVASILLQHLLLMFVTSYLFCKWGGKNLLLHFRFLGFLLVFSSIGLCFIKHFSSSSSKGESLWALCAAFTVIMASILASALLFSTVRGTLTIMYYNIRKCI